MKKRRVEKLVNGNIEVTILVRLKYDGRRTVMIVAANSGKPLE